jgi:VWFA-related protein
MFHFLRLVAILLLTANSLTQEAGLPPIASGTTFRVTARLVYVDVIVRDAKEHVVRGLTQQDFRVLEDGKPQEIDFFSAHNYVPSNAISDPVVQKPRSNLEFSNVPPSGASDAITILLFDLLNTPSSDQLYAREQMLKFLRKLPAGQRVALFTLTDRLRMIRSFTGSPELLKAAGKMLDIKDFNLINSQTEDQQEREVASEFGRQGRNAPGGPPNAMENSAKHAENTGREARTNITIPALGELARAMSGYPGRKSLFWLSESFPIALNTTQNFLGQKLDVDARETSNLLASERISVYPVSVEGLVTGPSSAAVRTPDNPWRPFFARENLKATMNDLAQQTGGEAIVGNNDLAGAILQQVEDGSNYYTVAYRPTNGNWNGQFREIRLELVPKGDTLIYRRGYFAADSSSADPLEELHHVLQPETPEFTALQLSSRVQLPDSQHSVLRVDSVLQVANIGFTRTPDGHRRAQLAVLLIALSDGQKQKAAPPQTSGTLSLDLTDDQYKLAAASGISIHQELVLKPGKYGLRLGVIDLTDHDIGTLDMSVTVFPGD